MKLVILDRDGTINQDSDDFVKTADEWIPLPGSLEAIAKLNHAGWHVVIATNQSGLGRGLFDVVSLNGMHAKMHKLLAAMGGRVDAVFYCPHAPDEGCACRKPRPGLVLRAAYEAPFLHGGTIFNLADEIAPGLDRARFLDTVQARIEGASDALLSAGRADLAARGHTVPAPVQSASPTA